MVLNGNERRLYRDRLLSLAAPARLGDVINRTICQDIRSAARYLPPKCVDLLFLDPPYNLTKRFRSETFRATTVGAYAEWMRTWLVPLMPVLKNNASVYLCGDWRSSTAIHIIAEELLIVRNRITWEREKGRGANANWKNASEDIWFCTVSDKYRFNLDAVKMKRRVIAPYTAGGKPKDWSRTAVGNFRLTHPSNLWTDLTVPFWSMPENTEHPTQKPEKLLAKIILASSKKGDVILDPFLGSGTTSVVAKKLGRRFIGFESDEKFASLAEKRIFLAQQDDPIQGYADGVFWERNSKY